MFSNEKMLKSTRCVDENTQEDGDSVKRGLSRIAWIYRIFVDHIAELEREQAPMFKSRVATRPVDRTGVDTRTHSGHRMFECEEASEDQRFRFRIDGAQIGTSRSPNGNPHMSRIERLHFESDTDVRTINRRNLVSFPSPAHREMSKFQ